MRRPIYGFLAFTFLLTTVGAIAATGDTLEEAVKKDRKLHEGTWKIVALEINGNKAEADDAKKLTVVNGPDGTWSLRSEGNEVAKGTSIIDPTRKPKEIELTQTEGEGKGKPLLGIYEIGERTRKLCIAPAGKDRPKEFSTAEGNEHILVTFERVSPK